MSPNLSRLPRTPTTIRNSSAKAPIAAKTFSARLAKRSAFHRSNIPTISGTMTRISICLKTSMAGTLKEGMFPPNRLSRSGVAPRASTVQTAVSDTDSATSPLPKYVIRFDVTPPGLEAMRIRPRKMNGYSS